MKVELILTWNWTFFIIGVFTLILIQFLREYKYHKNINFAHFKKYTFVFWFFNILYILFGAIFSTVLGGLLNPNHTLASIIYAGSWEGILGNLVSDKENKIKGVHK